MFLELKLMRIRRREQKILNTENLTEFNYIKHYISNSTLSFFEREEALQQILDSMLEAQAKNKSIDLFLGSDINEFCDSIIMEYSTSKSLMLKTINFIEQLIIFISLWISLDMLFSSALYFKLSSLISAALLCIVSFIFIQKSKLRCELKLYFYIFGVYIIITSIIHILVKPLGLNLNTYISFYSIKNVFVISIALVLMGETYKAKCNTQR